jgi:hypothetical protein
MFPHFSDKRQDKTEELPANIAVRREFFFRAITLSAKEARAEGKSI